MLPFHILKSETRAKAFEKTAERLSKEMSFSMKFYDTALEKIAKDEKQLEEYSKKLSIFGKGLTKGGGEMASLTGGKRLKVKVLAEDVGKMAKHIGAARQYLGGVKKGILQRKEILAMSNRAIKYKEPYRVPSARGHD